MSLVKKILLSFFIYFFFCIIYILSFRVNILKINVYFYKGIFNLILITILLIVFLYFLNKYKKIYDIKDKTIIVLLFLLTNFIFFSMVPVTLERSISVFMLNSINKKEKVTKKEMEEQFIDKYVYENKAFLKRFNEQLVTGTIKKKNGKYYISKKGRYFVKIFKIINKIYKINSNVLE